MPRLSIIIPHQNHDETFENTLLSVLENQPSDAEIIAIHNGSYADAYDIASEVVLIDTKSTIGAVGLLNEATKAARASVIAVVLPGCTVNSNFSNLQTDLFDELQDLASISLPIQCAASEITGIAIDAVKSHEALVQSKLEAHDCEDSAGPVLQCGMYRKLYLQALGGWNESLSLNLADVDFSMASFQLGLETRSLSNRIYGAVEAPRKLTRTDVKQLAQLAAGYGLTEGGTSSAMNDLLRICLSGNVSHAVAWATGVVGNRLEQQIQERLSEAEALLDELLDAVATPQPQWQSMRRAA